MAWALLFSRVSAWCGRTKQLSRDLRLCPVPESAQDFLPKWPQMTQVLGSKETLGFLPSLGDFLPKVHGRKISLAQKDLRAFFLSSVVFRKKEKGER